MIRKRIQREAANSKWQLEKLLTPCRFFFPGMAKVYVYVVFFFPITYRFFLALSTLHLYSSTQPGIPYRCIR